RIIAGTLIEAGEGRIKPGDIPGIIDSCDRDRAGDTAPAKGLTLIGYEFG
ncbi:MAG: tRNA pseudouridine(38-40) synthase TruA, partial [Lachnospiraceae bacterium]|nr:tRNA pseudouridine(38-40) synthase TruA [Lachnospiraceae bacterium]